MARMPRDASGLGTRSLDRGLHNGGTRKRRWAAASLTAVLIAVVIGVGNLTTSGPPTQIRVYSGGTCSAPSLPRDGGSPLAVLAGRRLLFLGASYSIGVGATSHLAALPQLVAGRLGDRYTVDAVSGSGFLNPGPSRSGTFAYRLARDPQWPAPRLVLIQGGRNDTQYAAARETTAVLTTVKLAQKRFRYAQIVLLGPIPASLPVSQRVVRTRDAIAAAARTAHAAFIDPIAEHWITAANEHRLTGPVHGHPNNAGYVYIAAQLVADLPAALARAQVAPFAASTLTTCTDSNRPLTNPRNAALPKLHGEPPSPAVRNSRHS